MSVQLKSFYDKQLLQCVSLFCHFWEFEPHIQCPKIWQVDRKSVTDTLYDCEIYIWEAGFRKLNIYFNMM